MRWLALMLGLAVQAWAAPLVLEGALPDDGPDFVMVPFEVPPGTVELSIAHPVLQPENVLDYGLFDPAGFRGWGGGNDEPLTVGVDAASRSYLPGTMPAGTWQVVIGKAKVVSKPARYRLELELRTAPTLPPQPERRRFVGTALKSEVRWYAGDLHVHSRESGDAHPTLDALASVAAQRGLDFIELSEHNTTASVSWLADVQGRHPALLLLPGVEFITYAGHANGIGATAYVDHRLGVPGVTLETALAAFAAQDVVFSINHPLLDLGTACIGCAWKHPIPRGQLGAVEIATGGWDKTGELFTTKAIAWWDRLAAQGVKAAPIGGSDDHSGGAGTGAFDSPVGSPTTMIFANELSPSALLAGLRAGRTVVKLQGPTDPMVVLTVNGAMVGDVVEAREAHARLEVTGGEGAEVLLLRDGVELTRAQVDAASFTWSVPLTESGRYRAHVVINGAPRTITNHVWVTLLPAPASSGCSAGAAVWVGAVVLWWRRRGPRATRPGGVDPGPAHQLR